MVFQNYALYPHLTVYENIAFPLRLAGASDDEVDKKVRDASKTLELDEHLERKPGNLSGGQRQRVAMGRAIVRDADAFLFDEPLSNLDAKLRGQMRTEIARLQKRLGITTVYVTHDQTEAMTLGDRVAVLKRGVLQQLATPRELYEQPGQPVRRRLHRLPADELPARRGRGHHRSSCRSARSRSPAEKAEKAQGKGLLIAGIRPEHFEDASVVDDARRAGLDVPGQGRRRGVARQRGLRLHPVRGAARGAGAARRSSSGTSTARRCAPSWSISLDGASRIAEGDEAEIWVDAARMHLFDPAPARTSPSTPAARARCPTPTPWRPPRRSRGWSRASYRPCRGRTGASGRC